ncbi:hypothetical protein CY34DRAFT_254131 [Suillus luteus UH-Slu-Lm8-n1]|uniref:Uncharacterized protein n=1 Tax=Suillus luteus UH-Slu-Lm8-n1 TaxID=930992 RepID=A0A0D0BAT1_9AGAM|nr:hypothetical protein CY34DRAFT_254131 [Suillus luteus UH-Slu-Lm8-n1]
MNTESQHRIIQANFSAGHDLSFPNENMTMRASQEVGMPNKRCPKVKRVVDVQITSTKPSLNHVMFYIQLPLRETGQKENRKICYACGPSPTSPRPGDER